MKLGTRLEATVDVSAWSSVVAAIAGMGDQGWQKAQGPAFGFTVPFTQSALGLWVTGLSLALLVEPTAHW